MSRVYAQQYVALSALTVDRVTLICMLLTIDSHPVYLNWSKEWQAGIVGAVFFMLCLFSNLVWMSILSTDKVQPLRALQFCCIASAASLWMYGLSLAFWNNVLFLCIIALCRPTVVATTMSLHVFKDVKPVGNAMIRTSSRFLSYTTGVAIALVFISRYHMYRAMHLCNALAGFYLIALLHAFIYQCRCQSSMRPNDTAATTYELGPLDEEETTPAPSAKDEVQDVAYSHYTDTKLFTSYLCYLALMFCEILIALYSHIDTLTPDQIIGYVLINLSSDIIALFPVLLVANKCVFRRKFATPTFALAICACVTAGAVHGNIRPTMQVQVVYWFVFTLAKCTLACSTESFSASAVRILKKYQGYVGEAASNICIFQFLAEALAIVAYSRAVATWHVLLITSMAACIPYLVRVLVGEVEEHATKKRKAMSNAAQVVELVAPLPPNTCTLRETHTCKGENERCLAYIRSQKLPMPPPPEKKAE